MEYLHNLKSLSDELSKTGRPVEDDDFLIQVLDGLRPEFESIEASIRTHGVADLEELHSLLTGFEEKLQRRGSRNITVVIANSALFPGSVSLPATQSPWSRQQDTMASLDIQEIGRAHV